MSRFVKPDIAILTLANGDQLIVRQRLNTGERRRMFANMYAETRDGARADQIDPLKTGVAKVVAYLLDWKTAAGETWKNEDAIPVVIRDQPEDMIRAALEHLEYADFTEILRAIEIHEKRMDEIRAEEKKSLSGVSISPPILPLPSGVGGGTNG